MRARLLLVLLGICAIAALLSATAAAAFEAPGEAAARRLAERYVPIAMLREEQHPPCETSAEQYQPTSVETMLGNPKVVLQHYASGKGMEDVSRAPTAAEVAGLKGDYYLNLPGSPVGDTCVYARDFRQLLAEGKAPAITYAHIAREPNHSGFALQYWFFWYFNQFNDLHEGDWEGMQLTFASNTTQGALREEPGEMILFQHSGGERADWNDSKVQKEGTHPIVYPAAGSHATFYSSAVYVENGQGGSGVGCDNTSAPVRELKLQPVLLPEAASETSAFKWLTYDGRWGEREKGYNNGPTGPATKTVWRHPFSWMEGQRSTSPRLPGGSIAGPQVTKAFCGAVAGASELINLDAKSRPAAIATIVAIVLVIALLVGLTRWGPVDLEQLRERRAFGQLLRTARRLYGRYWRVLLPIGLAAFPILGAVNLLASLLAGGRGLDDAAGHSGIALALADFVEQFGRPVASAIVAAVVIVFVRELDAGAGTGFLDSFRRMLARFWRVVAAQVLAVLAVFLLIITVVGIPVAVYKYVAWQFVQQEVLFTDKSIREAFRASGDLVRGRWWHTVRVAGFLWLLSLVVGPVVGFALIFTSLSLLWINVIGALVFSLFVPYVALGNTLLYFDLAARAESEGVHPPHRIWRRLRRLDRHPRPAAAPGVAASG